MLERRELDGPGARLDGRKSSQSVWCWVSGCVSMVNCGELGAYDTVDSPNKDGRALWRLGRRELMADPRL